MTLGQTAIGIKDTSTFLVNNTGWELAKIGAEGLLLVPPGLAEARISGTVTSLFGHSATRVAGGVRSRAESLPSLSYKFKPGEDILHFGKHSPELIETFGYKNYSLQEYIKDANFVIKNGTYAPELNGYVAIAGGKGSAKGIVVGLDRTTNEITTLHLKPVSYLERKAPSLGWSSQPKSQLTDLIGSERELGWKSPYRRSNP